MLGFECESVCIGCGCSDMRACDEGCYWLAVDREEGIGVCSSCPESMKDWESTPRGLLVRKSLVKRATDQIVDLRSTVDALRVSDLNAFDAMPAKEQRMYLARKEALVEAYRGALVSLEMAKVRLEQV